MDYKFQSLAYVLINSQFSQALAKPETARLIFQLIFLSLAKNMTAHGPLKTELTRGFRVEGLGLTQRVQVPNNHILTQTLYYNYYYLKPKYLIIGYMDPLGKFWETCRGHLSFHEFSFMFGDFVAAAAGLTVLFFVISRSQELP